MVGVKLRDQSKTNLNPNAMVDAEPEEQQRTQEQSLEESIQRAWKPAVHQEGEREKRIWTPQQIMKHNQWVSLLVNKTVQMNQNSNSNILCGCKKTCAVLWWPKGKI